MNNEIMVSVCCSVYNHEKYLRQCLDGFMMQKTNFKFEVLIHDDASTDGSADIIREYEAKYPDVIKPIYQTENQYSKGVKISWVYQYPRAKGKYIALCEGDDYWTSPYKLQKQLDYMEKHQDRGLCAHQVATFNSENGFFSFKTKQFHDKEYTVDEVILGGGGLFGTNSLFMRTRDLLNMPDCFWMKEMGDFQLALYGTICGGCHYLKDTLSCYRINTNGSFTNRFRNDLDLRIELCKNKLEMIDRVDKYYNYKYTDSLQKNANVTRFYLNQYINHPNEIELDFKVNAFRTAIKKAFPFISVIKRKIISLMVKKSIKKGLKYHKREK